MSEEVEYKVAQEQISELLVGSFIDQVQYYVTGWELRVITDSGTVYNVGAAEIEVPGAEQWWSSLPSPIFSLTDTNEPEDTLAAIAIFTVLNRWPINRTVVDGQGNLVLAFENQCQLNLLAVVDTENFTWNIRDVKNKAIFFCDSGSVYKNS